MSLEEKKDYIASIFNYCDRWCERCEFTSRCRLYASESKMITHEIIHGEIDPEKLFDQMDDDQEDSANEPEAGGFWNDDVEEYEFDEEEFKRLQEAESKFIDEHLLTLLSSELFNYARSLVAALESSYGIYKNLNNVEEIKDEEKKKLYDSFETLSFYYAFIGAKIHRALGGKFDIMNEDSDEMAGISAFDMNGSAKIAALSVKKIIDALETLDSVTQKYHNEIANLLIITGKMLNGIDNEFPSYKDFKRPGFDD